MDILSKSDATVFATNVAKMVQAFEDEGFSREEAIAIVVELLINK